MIIIESWIGNEKKKARRIIYVGSIGGPRDKQYQMKTE